jgi:ABC-2 type transport system ATP-binding protein
MGLIHPTRGSATVFGLDGLAESVEVKRLAGYVPAELPQFGGLRGADIVGHFGALRGGVDQARVKEITERLDLNLRLKFRDYSTGNKRKLAILLALMHRPKLLVLDEPSSGLDPLNQQEFFKLVREARAAGATVFMSSHVLSEVEHVCERVGIIRRGRLVKVARTWRPITAASHSRPAVPSSRSSTLWPDTTWSTWPATNRAWRRSS